MSNVCNERFSWANGGGKLHRLKVGVLAGLLKIDSFEGFADEFGPKWAYQLREVIQDIDLPYYEDMKLAKLDGWDLENEHGEPWPFPNLELSAENVGRSHLKAYVRAKEILLRRPRPRPDEQSSRIKQFKSAIKPPANPPARPVCKTWLEHTTNEN